MKTWSRVIIAGIAMAAALTSSSAQSADDANRSKLTGDEILQTSDLSRNGWNSYSVLTTIINYEDGELKEKGSFDVSIKGMNKTLVKFMNADVKGQYLLMVDDDMWIYMPNTRKPIRITPLQRLMGDASNGDVARTRYAEDYSAKLMREESVNGVPCYVLDLDAKRDGATYKRIEYWVEKETKRPKKAEMYLASGKHYKSITFDHYEETGGRVLLTQMTITDRLREGRTTVMKYASYAEKELPEKYFNKDYLEKLR
ncbi:MAG TPA: outer membrane lipoprotein-sorting protein [Bacteroidota bacterium]|nr:outer membrane lipoprotein-sorting protein [Bacteroidota bacterium]